MTSKSKDINWLKRKTLKSLAVGLGASVGGALGWRWILRQPQESEAPWPLRKVLRFNEAISRAFFSSSRQARTFPLEDALEPRANGDIGLGDDFDPLHWSLKLDGNGKSLTLKIQDIKDFPKTEIVTQLKCIEGWSTVVHWGGVRLADVLHRHDLVSPQARAEGYVGLETPDGEYYVGLEMDAAVHDQTLLAYEMNGQPLPLAHGAPLRLATPIKYGIKNIKRIASLKVTLDRPRDYWAEQGYDYYAGF
jgi:DMSO/TMAO reductase YedYZ molybdopterin-dependent catalytic subunit